LTYRSARAPAATLEIGKNKLIDKASNWLLSSRDVK
jgi:hypothetical protein